MAGDALIWIVVAALWVLVIGELVLILALARQIGQLHLRLAPAGARTLNAGPELGASIDRIDLVAVDGTHSVPIYATGKRTIAVFVSPTCGVCDRVIPALHTLSRRGRSLRVLALASSTSVEQNREFVKRTGLRVPFVDGSDLTDQWHVAPVPYAVLFESDGRVASKGMVNNLEQLESLLRVSTPVTLATRSATEAGPT
jgi:methylamine dehydrogenase accessory protein MauD